MAEPDARIDEPRSSEPPDEARALDLAPELASILDRYMADLKAGRVSDRRRLLDAHPDLARQLEACLAGIEFIHQATGAATGDAGDPGRVSDHPRARPRGHGGSLRGRADLACAASVALKVLRFGVVADEDAMNRFRREAETVARLHHTNIVPIFAVGCERGVHYYAMQLIAGRSLADVLGESQRTGKPLEFDDVARWGLQAAEALAHAHQRGRDPPRHQAIEPVARP